MKFQRLSLALALLLGLAGPVFAQEAGGGAAAGAAASVASPAASPSTATSTATTTATPDAGAASAVATPAGVDAPAAGLTQNAGESDGAFLHRVMTARDGVPEAGQGTPEPPPTPAPDGPQPGDDNGQKTEETPGSEADDEFGYDPFAPAPVVLAPKDLFAKINANAALKAALEADPETRETLIAQSRLAAETSLFKEVFISPDEAKTAAAASKEYSALSNLVTSIQKPEDAQGFYGKLLELSTIRDDNGDPILRDGKPVSDGTVGRLIHHTGALFLNHFEQLAKQSGNDELTAAVEILKGAAFSDNKRSTEGLTEEQRAEQTRLDEQRSALDTDRQAHQQAKTKEYEGAIVTGIDGATNDAIGSLLGRTDLAAGDRGSITEKIRTAVYELVANNHVFQQEQDALMRRTPGPKTQADRIALGRKWMNIALPIVAPKLIAEAGAKVLTKQQQQQTRQAARVEASRSEGAGTLRTPKPATPATGSEVTAQAISDFKTRNSGREPSTADLLAEIQRIRSAQ